MRAASSAGRVGRALSPTATQAGTAIAAAIGATLATGGLILVKAFVVDRVLAPAFQFTAFVGWDAIVSIAPILYITGIALACLAAFLTLRKYLRV